MDLIFKRYSSPFFIINEMIANNQLVEFINKLYDITNDEKIYEFWLHRVYGQSFEEYKGSLNVQKNSSDARDYSKEKVDVNKVVSQSMDILNDLKPNE